MISPPIIPYNWGDVEVFSSVEELERHIEPVDVANGEYLIPLSATVDPPAAMVH